MTYTKHTWASQELITSDKLNNLEEGSVSPLIPIDGVMKIRQTPSDITKITDLVERSLDIYGSWFEVTYISSNHPFSDAPSQEAYGTVEIVTRGTSRTYITFTDRNGVKYYSSISSGVLSQWYKAAVIDSLGNLQVAGISSIQGDYTVVTTYRGEI